MSVHRKRPTAAPRPALAQALRAVSKALQASGHSSMIIGGIAVIARGVPRARPWKIRNDWLKSNS